MVLRRPGVKKECLVLSRELQFGLRKEIRVLRFGVLALQFVRANSGIVGCMWFIELRYWWERGDVENKNK